MSSNIVVTQDAGVTTIRLDRPEKKNALNRAMYAALGDAIAAAERDDAVRVVLLCGAGGTFTAGNDLADFADRPRDGATPAAHFLAGISGMRKPLVAAVDGFAVGIGFTTLLHCDFVYASTRAKLRAPFIDLGLIPEAASTLLLPRIVGHTRAAELFMLGDELSPERARELGLVNAVLPAAELEAHARGVCARLAAKAPGALAHTKALLRDTSGSVEARMQREFEIFAAQLGSAEAREAISAFFDKRAPDFSKLR
ncbi:MAG: enoyl-CoA hydratase [Polyangiales bacterium]